MRFKEFHNEYTILPLGQRLKIKSGKSQKNIECNNGKYKIYGTGGIIGFTNKYLYDKESVGIGRKGTIDKPFYFNEPFWTVDTLFYSEIKENNVAKYIYYLFQTIPWKKYNTSTGVPSLTSSSIEAIEKGFPLKEEQYKIATFLSFIDKRIQTQIKIINKYESLIKSIEEEILWKGSDSRYVPIKEFLVERNEKSAIQDQYPVLSSTVKGLFLQSDYFQREIASSNNIGYKITKLNDIIISPQNLWMGNITYNDKFENGIISPSYHIYEIKDGYNKQYIATILKSHKAFYCYKNISEQGASVVRRNLNMDAFLNIMFPIPTKEKQDEAGVIIQQLHLKLDIEKQYLNSLLSQKTYLLNNMFI